MANWMAMSEKQKRLWDEWVAGRPQVIQDMASKFNLRPELVYRIRDGRDRCVIHSLHEGGAVTVNFLMEHNRDNVLFLFERSVFGVNPETLTEADYPFEVVDGTQFEDLEDDLN